MSKRAIGAALGLLLMGGLYPSLAAEDEGDKKWDLSKGGPTFQSGHNSLTIGARMQFRWTLDDKEEFDADTVGTGVGSEDGVSSTFAVQRMRVSLKGGMFKPWLKYEFQFELANTSGASDNKIKDAVLEFHHNELAVFKLGQYKTPFSFQQLTSSGRLQFVDRAITDAKFAPGRDVGVSVNGLAMEKKFGYSVGAFNGGGEGQSQDDQGLLYVGRVWFDPFGEFKLFESANDNSEDAVLHLGLGLRAGEAIKGTATGGVFEDPNEESALNFEVAYRQARLFALAEYFTMTDELDNPVVASDVDSSGWNAQVGFMVVPKTFELGLRYASIEPDEDVDEADVSEARLVAGYYWVGHNLKLQADVGRISYDAGVGSLSSIASRNLPALGTRLVTGEDLSDTQFRLQAQLAF